MLTGIAPTQLKVRVVYFKFDVHVLSDSPDMTLTKFLKRERSQNHVPPP